MAVLDPVELILTNRADDFSETLRFDYTADGQEKSRALSFSNRLYIERSDFAENPPPKYFRLFKDGVVRLKSGYIIKCTGFDKDKKGTVTKIYAEIIEGTKSGADEGKVKAKGTIHWVDAKNCIPITCRLYDYLLLDGESLESGFLERLNPNSLITKTAFAEPFLQTAQKGQAFQFLRLAYFVRDSKESDLVFNRIVSLKDTFKA